LALSNQIPVIFKNNFSTGEGSGLNMKDLDFTLKGFASTQLKSRLKIPDTFRERRLVSSGAIFRFWQDNNAKGSLFRRALCI
jgi:hypothetical protein